MPAWFLLSAPALALLLAAATAEPAGTRAPGAGPAPHAAPTARTSRRKPRIVHLPSPSEESTAQRDRRLARECRGLPNAGACLGRAGAHSAAGRQ